MDMNLWTNTTGEWTGRFWRSATTVRTSQSNSLGFLWHGSHGSQIHQASPGYLHLYSIFGGVHKWGGIPKMMVFRRENPLNKGRKCAKSRSKNSTWDGPLSVSPRQSLNSKLSEIQIQPLGRNLRKAATPPRESLRFAVIWHSFLENVIDVELINLFVRNDDFP